MSADVGRPLDPLVLGEAASRAGVGIVVARLAPPEIRYVNEAAAALLVVGLEELRTRAPFELVPSGQRDVLADRLRRRLAGEELPPARIGVQHADGRRHDVELRIGTVDLQGEPGAVVLLSEVEPSADIAADARQRAVLDAAPDGVVIVRAKRFLYANRTALALAGCATFEELAERDLDDLLEPPDVDVVATRTGTMLREGTRFPRATTRCADGRPWWRSPRWRSPTTADRRCSRSSAT